jgi:hypothetical protein
VQCGLRGCACCGQVFEVLCLSIGGRGVLFVFGFGVLITYDTLGVAAWLGWMRRDISDDIRAFASRYEKTQIVKRHNVSNYEKTYCVLPEISAVCCVPDMRRPLENNSISWLVILTSYAVMFELRWRMFLLYMRM